METITQSRYDPQESATVTETVHLSEADMYAVIQELIEGKRSPTAKWRLCRDHASKVETVIDRR